eukprot:augustus_masked-scaffold_101-processed-gene-0.12-mRNA-1 protein AED:1.00 eAED:1.00 QI:0/0/0/0/1/1/3/0/249
MEREKRKKKLEEQEVDRRRREQEDEEGNEELFGADSSSSETSEEEEGRTEELSDEKCAALRKSHNLPTADEVEESASGKDSQMSDEEVETQAKPSGKAEEAESEAAAAEYEAGKEVAIVRDEADIMDLTQPTAAAKEVEPTSPTLVQDDEVASTDEAFYIEKSTSLERVLSEGRNKIAEAETVNLTSPPSAKKKMTKGKAAPKTPRKKRFARNQAEFYLKTPRWFTPKKYVIYEEDLREVKKEWKVKRR